MYRTACFQVVSTRQRLLFNVCTGEEKDNKPVGRVYKSLSNYYFVGIHPVSSHLTDTGKELGAKSYESFEPDILLYDGDMAVR